MKRLALTICVVVVLLSLFLVRKSLPGTYCTPHDWMSTKLSVKFVPIRFTVHNPNKLAKSFCFDICVLHGDWKRMKCADENMIEIQLPDNGK